MIDLRKAAHRAHTRTAWLDSRHSFSFGAHFDPDNLGFGPLRVINEDRIAPRSGFPAHPHRNMEILTYLVAGTLTHQDSEGNTTELRPGRLQRMQAGHGIVHSELNLDPELPVQLLQIWIEPGRKGLAPGHVEHDFTLVAGEPTVLASTGGERGGVALSQDAALSALRLDAAQSTGIELNPGRRAWIQVVHGHGHAGELAIEAGDGLAIEDESGVELMADESLELLVFDLPGADA